MARGTVTGERGAVVIFVAVALVALLAMLALVVDLSRVYWVRAELQKAADAAAFAAAAELPDLIAVEAEAVLYGQLNVPGLGTIIAPADVVVGHWDAGTKTFLPGASPLDAVWVQAQRSEANGNPVQMFFAGLVGFHEADVAAVAIATRTRGDGGSRFLIDDEMFDIDVPEIEAAAAVAGVSSIDLLTDANGDWFIDFYDLAGPIQLELPTGQVGDEALFDIDHPAFSFNGTSSPSFEDFLNYNEDGTWREALIPKAMLDPLVGVDSVDDPSLYPSFVNPAAQVSPVYKSDVGDLGLIGGVPAVDARGERRGLVAFEIVAVGSDPDGPGGSLLPNLIIELVDPATVSLTGIAPGVGGLGSIKLVG